MAASCICIAIRQPEGKRGLILISLSLTMSATPPCTGKFAISVGFGAVPNHRMRPNGVRM